MTCIEGWFKDKRMENKTKFNINVSRALVNIFGLLYSASCLVLSILFNSKIYSINWGLATLLLILYNSMEKKQ